MNGFLLGASLFVAVPLTIAVARVWAGPTVFDRLLAIALVTANTLVVLVLVGSVLGRVETTVDIALGYALLTFVLPIAIGRYLDLRRRVDTRPDDGEGTP